MPWSAHIFVSRYKKTIHITSEQLFESDKQNGDAKMIPPINSESYCNRVVCQNNCNMIPFF